MSGVKSFAYHEGCRLAHALYDCKTKEDLKAFMREVRAHPIAGRPAPLALIQREVSLLKVLLPMKEARS